MAEGETFWSPVPASPIKHPCPCCGYQTLREPPPGTFETCPVCRWEDDNIQFEDPTYEGGETASASGKHGRTSGGTG
jgi:hypothetical protein